MITLHVWVPGQAGQIIVGRYICRVHSYIFTLCLSRYVHLFFFFFLSLLQPGKMPERNGCQPHGSSIHGTFFFSFLFLRPTAKRPTPLLPGGGRGAPPTPFPPA